MKISALPGMTKNRSTADIALFAGTMQSAGLDPAKVAPIIEFESARTWSPAVKGPKAFTRPPGYAVGLIQFAPDTAIALGTTTADLEKMTFAEQLPFVVEHFKRQGIERLKSLGDYYAAVFWPAAVGQPDSYVIASAGSPAYEANKGLDHGQKGQITKADLSQAMQSILASATSELDVVPSHATGLRRGAGAALGVGLVVVTGILGFFLLRKGRP